ncbi:MAG TPA: hypothetical protein VLH60_07875 [Sedimentisphaerales bacterium]|nr:hypothetical protein [Sedimentisphaerales bacterium]
MLLYFVRSVFIISIIAVLFVSVSVVTAPNYSDRDFVGLVAIGLGAAILVFIIDVFTPRKQMINVVGMFFALLIGTVISWGLSYVIDLVNEAYSVGLSPQALTAGKIMMGMCICYLVVSFVMRTKDDIRFVVPYVEFAKQNKTARPLVLDTSVIIDGRIADLCETKLFDAPLIVPRFVLNELQLVADSSDKLKRNRGRRGLDMLNKMQCNKLLDITIDDTPVPAGEESADVDYKLVSFTKACDGRLVTNDFNLAKVASLREVDVVNINDIANALKPIVLPGEPMEVKIIKAGEEMTQGIGYLDDGTMVVVENARDRIGETILLTVTSSLQTSAGRMIFGRFERAKIDNEAGQARPAAAASGNWDNRRGGNYRRNNGPRQG